MTVTLTGCVQSSSGSSDTLYDSIDDLAADSSSIVVGTVSDSFDEDDTTVAVFEVTNAPSNLQLGAILAQPEAPVAVGETVEVRSSTSPLLEVGDEYLLFLTPTMLDGDASGQFFITGAGAGAYVRDGSEFRRVLDDTGDTLPDTIDIAGDSSE